MARGRIASPVDEGEDFDEDGQDEEASRKRQRTIGKSKKAHAAAIGAGVGSDSDGDPLTEDEEAVAEALRGWTVDTFTDKPVQATKPVLQQLKKMQDSLQNQIGIMENSISRITDVAVAHEDSRWGVPAKAAAKAKPTQMRGKARVSGSDDGMDAEEEDAEAAPVLDDAEEKRNEETAISLENKVKQLCDEIKWLECKTKAIGEVVSALQQDTSVEDIAGEVNRRFVKIFGNYRDASDRIKYKNSEQYKDFKQAVWDIRHDEACPPISSFLEKGPDDPESDDDDIEIGGTTQDFKCPLTLLPFDDAVRSTKCPHSFSGAAIRGVIRQGPRKSAKCPVAGCDKVLTMGDIKPDPVLQKRSDQVKSRLQRRRQEEEAAEAEDAELIE
ncbi:hypothetical protein NCC49_005807 [Naganishia albida]|nr:hypothetical protein NCC49_005807 [Naganishia albida]